MVVAVGEENRDPNIPTNNADAESTAAPAVVQQKTENAQANDDHPTWWVHFSFHINIIGSHN